jgi:hypothetical protein
MSRLVSVPAAVLLVGLTFKFSWPELKIAWSLFVAIGEGKSQPRGALKKQRRALFFFGIAIGALVAAAIVGVMAYNRPERDLGIADLFEQDFAQSVRFGNATPFNLNDPSGRRHTLIGRVLMHPEAHSYFVAWYIGESGGNYDLCTLLSTNYLAIAQVLRKSGFSIMLPGDVNATTMNDMVFTELVYIYHQDVISQDQQTKLRSLFDRNGASLVLRGPEYLYTRQMMAKKK